MIVFLMHLVPVLAIAFAGFYLVKNVKLTSNKPPKEDKVKDKVKDYRGGPTDFDY